jgi:hypothetical protein
VLRRTGSVVIRKLALALATVALIALPVVGIGRTVAWITGPFSAQSSLAVIQSAAPEIRSEGDYVSSLECRGCHPQQYRTWRDSYHRTMTQLATPDAVLGDFDGVELSWLPPAQTKGGVRNLEHYRLSQRGDEFWMTLLSQTPGQPDLDARIVMTTGSHHQQVVWVRNGGNGRLINLPWVYLIDSKRWIPRTDSFLAPPDDPFGLVYWSDVCIECHSVQGRPRVDGLTFGDDTQVTELGIACESCHGPAGPHVAANRLPWNRFLQRGHKDPSIVNPARLTAEKSSQVCGRCHSVLSYPGQVDTWNGKWNDYLPGEDLESGGRLVVHPESKRTDQQSAIAAHQRGEGGRFLRERFWTDGALRVTGRELNDIQSSPCYVGEEFSCLSCHSMHDYENPSDQLAKGVAGDQACLQCHDSYERNVSAHTRHAADSEASRCANCHMPYTSYGLRRAIRSHRVSSPSVAAEVATGRPNACNTCHLDRSLAWTQSILERDYGTAEVLLDAPVHDIASGPRWIATGDAGVRALAGWYMGWEPARIASGSDWMAPYLAELLADSYAAVRAIASNSVRSLPGFGDLEYDFVRATGSVGRQARADVRSRWIEQPPSHAPGPLITANHGFDRETWATLLKARETRPISLSE